MSILLTKAQKVAGFDCPNGTLVIGLEKDVEALAAQGGGALPLDIGLVSGDGSLLTSSLALAWGGQSLEAGPVLELDSKGVKQRAYIHAPAQNYYEPDSLNKGASGSYMTPVLQKLAVNDKLRVFPFNCAVGGSSAVKDWCGVLDVGGWRPNRAYRAARASLGNIDPGTRGEVILEGGRIWEATTGCTHLAFWDSTTPITVGGFPWRTNLTYIAKNTDRTSATAKPTFDPAAVVGDTVVDNGAGSTGGGIVWTCRVVSAPGADADGYRVLRPADYGFDPYFALERAANALMSAPTSKRFFAFANATGDVALTNGAGAAITTANIKLLYSRAHQFISNYMGNAPRGIKTIHWVSLYYPASTTTAFNALQEALYTNGISGDEVPGTSQLATYLTAIGWVLGTPGGTVGNYYIIPGLYKGLGTDVTSLLQQPQPDPHQTLLGSVAIANFLYPHLRKVLLDVAT